MSNKQDANAGNSTHTHTHTQPLWTLPGTTWVSRYQKKHSPTHTYHGHPLSASSIHYDPWHPPCSIYVPDSLFPQSLSKFPWVYLLAWHPQLHTPYISSRNHCLLFAAHAHTIPTCFAAVPRLSSNSSLSLSTLYLELLYFNTTHPSNQHTCSRKHTDTEGEVMPQNIHRAAFAM